MTHARPVSSRRRHSAIATAIATALLIATQFMVVVPAARAATNDLRLRVESARAEPRALGGAGVDQGDAIASYKWMINLDNTGTTEQRSPGDDCSPESGDYPTSCHWTSIAGLPSSSPVVAQGDETTLSATTALMDLPDGRYLISVLADGFKLDGTHFSVPLSGSGTITVTLQPHPLPTATIKAQVFKDTDQANGQYDPGEDGLAGFAGRIANSLGQVTTDVFGNPLCTTYETDGDGQVILDGDLLPTVLQIGSKCLSDADGVLTIPTSARTGTRCPWSPRRLDWIQTTTLEGNHDWDAWVMEGATGLDTEFVVAGEPFPAMIFGFVPGRRAATGPAPTTRSRRRRGTITGVVDAIDVYVPPSGGLTLPGTIWGGIDGAKVDQPIDRPWVTLSDLDHGDTAVWVGRGAAERRVHDPERAGRQLHAHLVGRAAGLHPRPQQVTVANGEVVDLGVLPLTGWWTEFDGYVFNDTNRNGKAGPTPVRAKPASRTSG